MVPTLTKTYIYIWFRKVFDFSEKLLKKAAGDPKMEPKSFDFREKIATNRQHHEKKLVFEASEKSIKKREKKSEKRDP